MVQLSWWEQFIVAAAISLLTMLQSKLTNELQIDGLKAAVTFLQELLAGTVAVKSGDPSSQASRPVSQLEQEISSEANAQRRSTFGGAASASVKT
jgi:hypothetical protein